MQERKSITANTADVVTGDVLKMSDFDKFLRLHVADGDASPATIRSYWSNAAQFVGWCRENDVDPATATEDDVATYRHALAGEYERGTVATKLAAVRRLYAAVVWRGLRTDNPAAGLRAPKDRTDRSERVKYLPLDGFRRLLNAPKGNDPAAARDRAILALLGWHALRVAEVARPTFDTSGRRRSGLAVEDVNLDAGTVQVYGKGAKRRTVHLVEPTVDALRAWLAVRDEVANADKPALFVALARNGFSGGGMSVRAVRYLVDAYLKELGLKSAGVSCHSLRHSAGTWARAAGAKLDAIADLFGHASTDMTRQYAKIVNRMTENPARYLETLLAGTD